jgi:hypothetical protein
MFQINKLGEKMKKSTSKARVGGKKSGEKTPRKSKVVTFDLKKSSSVKSKSTDDRTRNSKSKDDSKRKYKEVIYSDEMKKDMLKNYSILPPDEWGNITYGNHVRYQLNNGKFRRGGMISNIFEMKGVPAFQLRSGDVKWTLLKPDIAILWKKSVLNGVNTEPGLREIGEKIMDATNQNTADIYKEIINLTTRVNKLERTNHALTKYIYDKFRRSQPISQPNLTGGPPALGNSSRNGRTTSAHIL